MEFDLIIKNIDLFFQGTWMTLRLLFFSLLIGGALSIPLAIARATRHRWFNRPVWMFTYFFRGTPLLVQTYLIYNGLSQFDFIRDSIMWTVLRDAYWCALIAFSLNTCAYTTEILRGFIETTPRGEIEAARAAGMGPWLRMRRIILPSAFRRALPAYSNEVIFMLHGSAIASVITLMDILGAGRTLNARYYLAFEGFLTSAVFYLSITLMLTAIFRQLERKLNKHLHPRIAVS